MNNNIKVNKANVIPVEVLKHQIQIANCDGFDCFQVKTLNKNMMCYYGAKYPEAIKVNGQIYTLWINAINQDYYYISKEHLDYIEEMKQIHAIDSERDDLEGF